MIKADKDSTTINGNPIEISEQFIAVVQAVRETFSNAFGSDVFADKAVDAFYELSKYDADELKSKTEEEIMKTILGI